MVLVRPAVSGKPEAMSIDPNLPVIVGVGQCSQRPDDPADALETIALMEQAARVAADDAGAPNLLASLDLVSVVYGAWRYSDPGRLLARSFGADDATTQLSFHGGNTPQAMVNSVARSIQAGELGSALIVGGETIWSRRRQRAQGVDRKVTDAEVGEPDRRFGADVTMSSEFEASRGLEAPINFYPLFESAIRADNGEGLDEHRTRISELWAGFNAVAVDNPHAWLRTPMTAEEIRDASPTNRMVGFPYTKALNSNWDLDQAAALLVCSVGAAQAAGIPTERWVFPLAGTDAHDTPLVSNRVDLHSSPAIRFAGKRLFELSGVTIDDVGPVDVYSCFPSAVQIACAELGLSLDRQLTVTGGLPFAGGPLNNYVTHSIAAMCDVLRSGTDGPALVTANGGYITKHALGLYDTSPPGGGFVWADVQEEVDAAGSTPLDEGYVGPGTIEAYTVMHDKEGPTDTLAAIRTPDGARTWARTDDRAVADAVLSAEAVGSAAAVEDTGRLRL